jgi:hypothetical protein
MVPAVSVTMTVSAVRMLPWMAPRVTNSWYRPSDCRKPRPTVA